MMYRSLLLGSVSLSGLVAANPINPLDTVEKLAKKGDVFLQSQKLANPNFGPKPGESDIFNSYSDVAPPFPAYLTAPVLPTALGKPDNDDRVWQNLLSAEWIIYNFYQAGVEAFSAESFVAAGFPNTTYSRIVEIRNNEAGHLRIFQNKISSKAVKPGSCKYLFAYEDTPEDATTFLATATVLEISSMAFLTGLVQELESDVSKGNMLAIATVESRHETWSLIDLWGENPFGGPSDSVYPYAEQVLDTTRGYIVPGSCPVQNPVYPSPEQGLPTLGVANTTTSLAPGATVTLAFPDPTNQPCFKKGTQYYGVFFHGVYNVSVPIDTSDKNNIQVTLPAQFDNKGVIVAVVANEAGAPTRESVVAGPAIALEQPAAVGLALAVGA